MPQKKESAPALSAEEQDQVQHLLAEYQQIAARLHQSTDHTQLEEALAAINTLPEGVQLAFVQALAKEHTVEAADLLVAVNEVSPHKAIRKEARRSLIRLESNKIQPQWTPPVSQKPAVQVNITNAPRFWKGFATQSREEGEVQLLLCWEQGYDYTDVRILSFLLDFWNDGVKAVYGEIIPKRRFSQRIEEINGRMLDNQQVDCTLAEGKRLIEEALSINTWRGTPPDEAYRTYLPLITTLIMQASDLGEDRGRTFITDEMEDQEVVVNFIGAWSFGDFGLAYDLLTQNCALREDFARTEWIELRRAWHQEAHPTRLELGFVHERETRQSGLWLPSSAASTHKPSRKELEVGWSLELLDTPLSGTLKEMPLGTAINKETGRHWFWTNYAVIREDGTWRIQEVSDEGLHLQGIPIPELQARAKSYEEAIEKRTQQPDRNDKEYIEELSWRLTQLLHFYDALIVRLPLDFALCEEAYNYSVLIGNPERMQVYLERMVQRFNEDRANLLRRLGSTLVALAYKYDPKSLPERHQHLLSRAEETLRESLALEENALGHMLLGELFMSQNKNQEAEEELRRARELQPRREEEASIESGLGHLAMRTEERDKAITHYQRVVEIDPEYPGAWFSLGFAQRLQGNVAEAERCYEQAFQREPDDLRIYSELTAIYMNRGEPAQARALLEQGLRINPQSAHLHAVLASLLFEMGEQRAAQRHLEEAENIEPDLEIVQRVRHHLQTAKKRS